MVVGVRVRVEDEGCVVFFKHSGEEGLLSPETISVTWAQGSVSHAVTDPSAHLP